MLLNEMKFLGFEFMAVRWVLTVIAIIIFSWITEKIVQDSDLPQIKEKQNSLSINKSACMLDAVCSKNPTVRINGEDMSQQVVKSRFLKLNSSHIEYVFETLQKNPSDIRNIRSYLLTTLYNAFLTMDNYYTALVNHDMARW